ncbi:hypothetical protein HanXRQr2_Chr03g0098021 [Helianthus annuus]|uniref:Uncharacterized protein n=1 Tax=Helianthus annuus TaxID=4232 RepID=A0A9K3NVC5_HELAN|nr:hypothetical protein HanXRQr2_Chr03g0098021 [Helianthus annuus]
MVTARFHILVAMTRLLVRFGWKSRLHAQFRKTRVCRRRRCC